MKALSAEPVVGFTHKETELVGTITHILFSSGTDFFVARATTDKGTTILAGTGRVTVGQPFHADGLWVTHPRFGLQFKASGIRTVLPSSKTGLISFFGGGLAKNVGSVFAEKIVRHYGEQLAEILSGDPAQAVEALRRVPGVGRKRAEEVVRVWKEETEFRDLVEFCDQAGVDTKESYKIRRAGLTLSMLEKNPYALLTILTRPNFEKIDQLALKAQVDPRGPERLSAAVKHIVGKWSEEGGHTCMSLRAFDTSFKGLLPDIADMSIRDICMQARIKVVEVDGPFGKTAFIVTSPTEEILSEEIKRRAKTRSGVSVTISGGPICVLRPGVGIIQLTGEQSLAVKSALANPLHILSGGPGTGKTTIVKAYVDHILKAGVDIAQVLLCAPTGRAARRLEESTGVEAMTIHKAIGFGRNGTPASECPIGGAKVLVVDECSMVDTSLMRDLLIKTPADCKILFVGDPYQLPSIAPGKVLNDFIDSGVIPTSQLTVVHRQADGSVIPEFAAGLKEGRVLSLWNKTGLQFIDTPSADDTTAAIVASVKKDLDAGFSIRDVQVLSSMHKGRAGTIELNKAIQNVVLPPEYRGSPLTTGLAAFYAGDKVMQCKNDYTLGVMNGETGLVTHIDIQKKTMEVEFDEGVRILYDEAVIDNLRHAYAISVHKSQGGEYKKVYLVCDTSQTIMAKRQLIYTGTTRSKEELTLVGQKKTLFMAVNNETTAVRETLLSEFLRGRAKTLSLHDLGKDPSAYVERG